MESKLHLFRDDLRNFGKFMEDRGFTNQSLKSEYEVYRGTRKRLDNIKETLIVYCKASGEVTINEKIKRYIEDFIRSDYFKKDERDSVGLSTNDFVKDEAFWDTVQNYVNTLNKSTTYESCREVLRGVDNVEILKEIIYLLALNK